MFNATELSEFCETSNPREWEDHGKGIRYSRKAKDLGGRYGMRPRSNGFVVYLENKMEKGYDENQVDGSCPLVDTEKVSQKGQGGKAHYPCRSLMNRLNFLFVFRNSIVLYPTVDS